MNAIEAATVERVLGEIRAAKSIAAINEIVQSHDGWVGKAIAVEQSRILSDIQNEVRAWSGRWHTDGGPCGYMLRVRKRLEHEPQDAAP